jgi:thiamine biosynthesis lipoprotein
LLPAFLLLLLAACSGRVEPLHLSGATMGTQYHITWLPGESTPEAEAVFIGVDAVLEDINASMSTYRADSEISRFNAAPVAEWFPVSADFLQVFTLARQVSAASGGAYDVTVAPLVNLWGFGPVPGDGIPTAEAIAQVLPEVGQQWVAIDTANSSLRKQRPLQVDFSSIAKGYGVDKVAQWLQQQAIANYLVEIGGEVRVAGLSPRGTPWRIAVEKPESMQRQMSATLEISDVSVATSGDYRNYFEHDGQRYSHSIDPRTGNPVRHELVSVTVVHRSTALADAWATALTILGPDVALETARKENLAVYLISRNEQAYDVQKTPAIEQWLE